MTKQTKTADIPEYSYRNFHAWDGKLSAMAEEVVVGDINMNEFLIFVRGSFHAWEREHAHTKNIIADRDAEIHKLKVSGRVERALLRKFLQEYDIADRSDVCEYLLDNAPDTLYLAVFRADFHKQILAHRDAGEKIHGIKYIRDQLGWGLKEAKDYFEMLDKDNPILRL